MNFDPQNFFIGLLDFFSILLPGALLTFLLMPDVGPAVLGDRYDELSGAEAWAVFLFASYLVGHMVFLLGSWLDEFYDRARRHTLNGQITELARRNKLLPRPVRALIWLVFKGEKNLAVDRAAKIKQQALDPLGARSAVNTFQWSKALLTAESPESLVGVQRFEADSKFFRCFAVVLVITLLIWPFQDNRPLWGVPVVLLLLLLALWRYMEQRLKATNQAYWNVITLTAQTGKVQIKPATRAKDEPTRAGGVVTRTTREGATEYLLLEAKDDPEQWVLPKGHLEEGETHKEAAIREVLEETAVWASVKSDLGDVSYEVDRVPVTVRFYLMDYRSRGKRTEFLRKHEWLPLSKAQEKNIHAETRKLLTDLAPPASEQPAGE